MKNTDSAKDLKRTDIFKIDPRAVYIDWASNPRTDYGDEDEWAEHKGSIKAQGVRSAILVYWDDTRNQYCLAHGFRRMKATLELINEGVDIQFVPCQKVKNNEEEILFDHFTMNKGKELSEMEKAETFKRLVNGYHYEPKEIAEKTGVPIQKVYSLLKFATEATRELKETVKTKKTTMSTALNIVRSSKGSSKKQSELLAKSLENSKDGKVKLKDVAPKSLKNEESYKKIASLKEMLSGDSYKTVSFLMEFLDGKIDASTAVRKMEAHVTTIL